MEPKKTWMPGIKPGMRRGVEEHATMNDFAIIPAIDLKGGAVVHGSGGDRASYQPIETPLAPSDDAIAIARALVSLTDAPVLYVADLAAIEGVGNHFELCRDLASALPQTALWIDAGFSNVTDCAFWLPLGATLVIGTESVNNVEDWKELRATFGQSLVLSLDFAAEGARGPKALFAEAAHWPERIIVMSLDRVGTADGPDIPRLQSVVRQAGPRSVYASGGMRDIADLEAAEYAGSAGALIATALHRGAVTENEIAAFLQRRRSR
jgi:phosphoribosylformimino-5-aminoimidazole carboxamide ribotide isomerase